MPRTIGKSGLAALRKKEQDPERKRARAMGLTLADYRKQYKDTASPRSSAGEE